MIVERSAVGAWMEGMVRAVGLEAALAAVDVIVSNFTNVELAAFAADWSQWARPKQLAPPGDWISWGFLTGRRFGKTLAVSHFVNQEIEAGRAPVVALLAQDEANCEALQVLGPSGLMATASPDFQPEWQASKKELVYPNGARAIVRTPEVPGKIRGFDYALTWITEAQSWPAATREDAYDQCLLATSLGLARIVWDCTPKRRHPVLMQWLADAERDPAKHVIVRGHMEENTYLSAEYKSGVYSKFGGTAKGREEIGGEMLEDADGALWKQDWLRIRRVAEAPKLKRRVVSCDPAVTSHKGSDITGIVEVGLGADGRAYVLGDYSGKVPVGVWADLLIDRYVKGECDLVMAETNKGHDLVAQLLRAAAKDRSMSVVVFDSKSKEHQRVCRTPGVIFVKEVFASGAKEERAEPVATAYERGRVSHVGTMTTLEETMTTWEPASGQDSPGDMDALVHAVAELLDLTTNKKDPSAGFKGIEQANKGLAGHFRGGLPVGGGGDMGGI